MMPVISIVIPTYNRLNTLKLALESLIKQNFPKEQYEILICDNNSTDGTKEWINNLNQFNLKYLRGENKGRSGARNRGIKASKGEIILFTDADIIADGNLLKEHFKFHKKQKENIAVVGREIQINTITELNNNEIFAKTLHSKGRKKLPWLYFLTGNASVRKKDLITSGMFDEGFSGYGHEDLELGYRLIKNKIKIFYNHKAVNYHLHPLSFEEKCKKMYLAGKSTIYFYNKYKDFKIKLNLGVNFFSFFWHNLLSSSKILFNFINKKNKINLFKEIILQYHYLNGVKEALFEENKQNFNYKN